MGPPGQPGPFPYNAPPPQAPGGYPYAQPYAQQQPGGYQPQYGGPGGQYPYGPGPGKPPRKSGCLKAIVVLVLLLAAGGAAVWYFGVFGKIAIPWVSPDAGNYVGRWQVVSTTGDGKTLDTGKENIFIQFTANSDGSLKGIMTKADIKTEVIDFALRPVPGTTKLEGSMTLSSDAKRPGKATLEPGSTRNEAVLTGVAPTDNKSLVIQLKRVN